MTDSKTKPPPDPRAADLGEDTHRRRVGKIVHDDRGRASVEWLDAPQDYVRPVLELEDGTITASQLKIAEAPTPLSTAKREGFNPYQAVGPARPAAGRARRDLRALSQWIKLMREIEERKALEQDGAAEPNED